MQVNEWDTFHLKLRTGLSALQYLRYLLTTFYASGRKFHLERDKVSLVLLGEYFEQYRNPGFYRAHNLEFLKLRLIARLVWIQLHRDLQPHEKKQEALVLSQNVLLNPRAFGGQKHLWEGGFLRVQNRRLKRPHPEPRRIGVGYRDKGTAQDPSFDASPRWFEVAVSEAVRYGLIRSRPLEWFDRNEFFVPVESPH